MGTILLVIAAIGTVGVALAYGVVWLAGLAIIVGILALTIRIANAPKQGKRAYPGDDDGLSLHKRDLYSSRGDDFGVGGS